MKSIKYIIGGVFLAMMFSGCSIAPPQGASGPATFTFSESLWKSTDGGATWAVKDKGTGKANTNTADVLSMAINPYDGGNVFVGLKNGGILETTDGGETWNFMQGFTSSKAYGLALDPITGKTLYVSAVWQGRGKIFKTGDDGANWKEIYTSPSNGPLIISLLVDKKDPNALYATTSDNQVLKSTDAGTSWKNIYAAPGPVLKLAQDASDQNLLYAITTSGTVFRTRDGGGKFEDITSKVNKGFGIYSGSGSTILETDPSVANRVYLAGTSGILVSDDAGENWHSIQTLNDPKTFPVKALAINPQNPKEIICGAAQAIYKSVDGGENWTTSQFDNKMTLRLIEYDPTDPQNVYVGFTK